MKKKLFITALCLLLVCVLLLCTGIFGYYPHYKDSKKTVGFNGNLTGINIMSCNLRCINPGDLGKKSWFYRADLIMQNIEKCSPSVIGFQEATKWQYKYACDCLEGYDSVIEYRDKSPFSEGCPIFYRSDLYELKDKGSFWLSETPEVMSRDWHSKCYRICSYVILTDKETGRDFVVFNTHLDHVSDEARIKGIGVVLDKIAQFGSLPSVIMGDFNADENSETYAKACENFLDAKYQTPNTMFGCTYQNWGENLQALSIDYFMISKEGWTVNAYQIIGDTYDGVYPSDHFPIYISLELSETNG
ncbi:MAG: endonuclease/exonuclease/phosphatase family protein [Ruminococcaceae bacterium]|nr:endonuclease/exonuclease/phosphatase family protein [Oscillospiraceae bacterium]